MSDQLRFDGQVVVITGAANGLGRAHAQLLAQRGASVLVNDVGTTSDGEGERSAADVAAEAIVASGGVAVGDHHDISTREGATAVVAHALDQFGRLDAVVNNAGIVRDRSFGRMDPTEATSVLDVHLWGTFWTSQAAWKVFRDQKFGRIVNTTSTAAYLGNFGQANYGAAKGAIIGLTKVLALEGASHNIRVNAVAPAAATAMTDGILGDLTERLDPALVASLIAFLVHESCPVTGEVFHAGAGAVSRVFFSQTRGVFHPDLTPEHLRDEFSALMDESGATHALGIAEELATHGVRS